LKRWASSKSWYARLKMGKFTLAPIDEDSWLQQLKEFNLSSGFPDPSGEYFSLMAELDTVSQLPFKLETKCVTLMYVQRFGLPKRKGIELDLWSIVRSSGTSVLSALNRYIVIEMTRTRSQKAKAKANAKHQNGNREVVAVRVRKEVKAQNKRVKKLNDKINDMHGGRKEAIFTKKEVARNSKVIPAMDHRDSTPAEHRLSAYMRTLAKPFEVFGVRCPVNYNPAPTYVTHMTRLTASNFNLVVAGNSTTQFILGPGSNAQVNTISVPLTHTVSSIGAVGVAGFLINGPMNSAANPSGPGCQSSGLALGSVQATTNTAATIGLVWDNNLPYLTVDAGANVTNRTRWKLVSMGVRIRNETPELSRAGVVITVQPTYTPGPWVAAGLSSQQAFERFPSFKDHGTGSDLIEVSWIPRIINMTYCEHTAAVSNNITESAGIVIFINNPVVATPQNYSMEVVCNWEIGGSDFIMMGQPSVHQPMDRAVVEPTMSVLTNSTHTAAEAHAVAAQVSKTVSSHVEGFKAAAGRAVAFGKSAVAVGGKVADFMSRV